MTRVKIRNPYDRSGRMKPSLRERMTRVLGQRFTIWSFRHSLRWLSRYYASRALFECVEIETINRCNNTCSFCPVNAKDDPRELVRMDEALFRKIIDELSDSRYSNRIAFHSNNEPFLDKELIPRISYARRSCPDAFLFLYTNGSALNVEKLTASIDAGLDLMMINNYNDDLVLNDNISRMIQEIDQPRYKAYHSNFRVILREKTAVLSNRGGSAPNKDAGRYKEYLSYGDLGCTRPSRQLVIRPTGEISLCCNDPLGQVTLGDARTQTLHEIWHGSTYRELRRELLQHGRRNLDLCSVCDVADLSLRHSISVILKDGTRRLAGASSKRLPRRESPTDED